MSLLISSVLLFLSIISEKRGILLLIPFLIVQVTLDIFIEASMLEKWVKYLVIVVTLRNSFLFARPNLSYYLLFLFVIVSLLMILTNSSEPTYSGRNFMVIFLTTMALYNKIEIGIDNLLMILLVSTLLICIYLVNASIFGGSDLLNSYSDDFAGGVFSTTAANLFPLFIWIAAWLLLHSDLNLSNKAKAIIIVLICALLLLVVMRRSPLVLAIGGFIVMVYRQISIRNLLGFSLGLSLLLGSVSSTPLKDVVAGQFAAREDAFVLENLAKEGRIQEPYYVADYLVNVADISDIWFGRDAFSTRWFGEIYYGGKRTIHSDILSLICSNGIIGLILFLIVISNRIKIRNLNLLKFLIILLFVATMITGRFTTSITFSLPLFLLWSIVSNYKQRST